MDDVLHGTSAFMVSVANRTVRDGWVQLADLAGVPRRRLRRYPVLAGDAPIVTLVDGHTVVDAAAWARLVSLAPGAVALPTRTAAAFGLPRSAIRPPDRRLRLLDLLASRRRRLRRALRTLDADYALYHTHIEVACSAALAPGEHAPFEQLPAYALAARIDHLLDDVGAEHFPVLVDLLMHEPSNTRDLTELHSAVAHDHARVLAALHTLVTTLAGVLERSDLLDLSLSDVLRIARGSEHPTASAS